MVLEGKQKIKNKHKRHISCEQNKNRGIPIIVEEEDGMPTGASPSLNA